MTRGAADRVSAPAGRWVGVPAAPGRAVGVLRRIEPPDGAPPDASQLPAGVDLETEARRLDEASVRVVAVLRARAEQTGGAARAILIATAQMAADPVLLADAARRVRTDHRTAERAVWDAATAIADALAASGGHLADRAEDVRDVRDRLITALQDQDASDASDAPRAPRAPTASPESGPFVLTARDLAPVDTAGLDPHRVIALVTEQGGPQSHTAILARQLGIPAVVAVPDLGRIPAGSEVFVDGSSGIVESPVTAERRRQAAGGPSARTRPAADRGGGAAPVGTTAAPSASARVSLLANVGHLEDARRAAWENAGGVGLLRTEFLFLDRATEPSIAEQTAAYRAVLDRFPGRPVTVRTLDAGADKPLPFLPSATEPNPALGVRGYRTARVHGAVLDRQLEAIAAAAAGSAARVAVMAPMITAVEETEEFVARCRTHGLRRAGVMIETPAAALCAREILAVADFASLGTNDLTQYATAADRELGALADLGTAWHPGVLRLIDSACRGARDAGGEHGIRPVGVCGEAAGDPALAAVLVGLGITSLSMAPHALPAVADVLESLSHEECDALAGAALRAPTAAAARREVRSRLPILERWGL